MKGEKIMKRTTIFALATIMAMILATPVWAEKPLTPESYPGAKVVDTKWVKSNLGQMKIYDVRKKAEYIEGHIPGAISSTYKEKSEKSPDFDRTLDKLDLSDFPSNKSEPLIVHCNGPRCWKSYKTTVLLVDDGYTNVNWYREGYPDWKKSGNPVE